MMPVRSEPNVLMGVPRSPEWIRIATDYEAYMNGDLDRLMDGDMPNNGDPIAVRSAGEFFFGTARRVRRGFCGLFLIPVPIRLPGGWVRHFFEVAVLQRRGGWQMDWIEFTVGGGMAVLPRAHCVDSYGIGDGSTWYSAVADGMSHSPMFEEMWYYPKSPVNK